MKNIAFTTLFVIISIIYLFPLHESLQNIGPNDWDFMVFHNGVQRESIIKYNQLPFWNPYECGGNVLFAHPDTTIFSTIFLFVLIFGELAGLKIAIIAHLIIGMIGAFFLAKELKLNNLAALTVSFTFMLSSTYIARQAVGHTVYMNMVLIPLVLLFYIKSLKDKKNIILSAIILALTLTEPYNFSFTILILGIYSTISAIMNKNFLQDLHPTAWKMA